MFRLAVIIKDRIGTNAKTLRQYSKTDTKVKTEMKSKQILEYKETYIH
jgi:hypothetical protein